MRDEQDVSSEVEVAPIFRDPLCKTVRFFEKCFIPLSMPADREFSSLLHSQLCAFECCRFVLSYTALNGHLSAASGERLELGAD